jgi:hypothetical protein
MSPYIPAELRKLVREDAGERCGYCQSSEKWLGIAHDGTRIVGISALGRATVEALQMNHPLIVSTRQLWVRLGIHPP